MPNEAPKKLDVADRLHQNIMLIEAARRVASGDGTPEDAGDPIAAVLDVALTDLRALRDEFHRAA